MEAKPINAKDSRIIEKFLLFPKSLYVFSKVQNFNYAKEIRWLKKVRIKQIASPEFSVCGTMVTLEGFSWRDDCFVD